MSREEDVDLIDYSDDEIAVPTVDKAAAGAAAEGPSEETEQPNPQAKGSYVGVHSSGFRDFLLKPELTRAITDCGFEHPSEVQQSAIPQAIMGTDVLCQAKSGLGKTAVFVIACLQQLEPVNGEVSVVVICHARELAYQITLEFDRFSRYIPDVRCRYFLGGDPIQENIEVLSDPKTIPHIVVATPGRLNALVNSKHINLKHVKMFVIDECDKVLEQNDMRRDVQNIFRSTPQQKQVMMFTATLTPETAAICKKFLQSNHLEIMVDDESTLTLHGLKQYYIKLTEKQKNRKLSEILDNIDFNQVIIFVKSTDRATSLEKLLLESKFNCIAIHSGLPQKERIKRFKDFRKFTKRICVATDVFGRGIDMERVNLVVNYDMTSDTNSYLHRVGRAGRFGTKGLAISFVTGEDDETQFEEVKKRFEVAIDEYPEEHVDSSVYMSK